MSLPEIQKQVAQLSFEDRAKLRAQIDLLDFFADEDVMEEMTLSNRQAREGLVHSQEEVRAALLAVEPKKS